MPPSPTRLPTACPAWTALLDVARSGTAPPGAEAAPDRWPGSDSGWEGLLRLAGVHGLTSLVAWQAARLPAGVVPGSVAGRLRAHLQTNLRANLAWAAETLRLVGFLRDAGVPALPFKGVTLAAATGPLAVREFVDLDLLVAPGRLAAAREVLSAAGYRPALALTPRQEAAYLASLGQWPLSRDGPAGHVELHSRLLPQAFPFPVTLDDLWPRRRAVDLGGREAMTPGAEDLLLVLCAHGAKEQWRRLKWVADVAALLRREPGLDWARVEAEAARLQCRRLLGLGLTLARDLLGAPVPNGVARRTCGDPAVAALAASAARTLASGTWERPGGLAGALFHLRARERWRDGARYALSLALTPTVADWQAVPLPDRLFGLHSLVRPARLAGKYGRRLLGRLGRLGRRS